MFETGGLTWVEISLEKLHTFTYLFHLTKGALNQKTHQRSSSFSHKVFFNSILLPFIAVSLHPSVACYFHGHALLLLVFIPAVR